MSKEVARQEVHASEETALKKPIKTDRVYRAGSSSYLVARPLLYGLEDASNIRVVRSVPAGLKQLLASGEVDAAVLPSIDLPSFGSRLNVLPAGCLAASGPTLMAKIFSQVRPEELSLMWVDRQSRSTVALVQVLWAALHHRQISLIPYDPGVDRLPADAQSVLLLGDRVVSHPALGFDWHLDPVAMWHEMTGLPFVFGVWATLSRTKAAAMTPLLDAARRQGRQHIEEIAEHYAEAYGWPSDLALRCMGKELEYEFTDAHREGLDEFLELAAECKLIDPPPPLNYYKP